MAIDWSQMRAAEEVRRERLDALRADGRQRCIAWVNAVTTGITGPVPEDEKISWTAKEAAARAVLAGADTAEQTALISGEAAVTGEDPTALATRIIVNADRYRAAVSALTGLRRRAFAEIDAATTEAGVDAALAAMETGWADMWEAG